MKFDTMFRLLLLALTILPFGGCTTFLVLEHRERPRGDFREVQEAWIEGPVDARTLVQRAAGRQESAVHALLILGP